MRPDEFEKLLTLAPAARQLFVEEKEVPPKRNLAALIASFANARGGTIIFGVDYDNVYGLEDIDSATRAVEEAAKLISPPVNVTTEVIEYHERRVLTVHVPKGKWNEPTGRDPTQPFDLQSLLRPTTMYAPWLTPQGRSVEPHLVDGVFYKRGYNDFLVGSADELHKIKELALTKEDPTEVFSKIVDRMGKDMEAQGQRIGSLAGQLNEVNGHLNEVNAKLDKAQTLKAKSKEIFFSTVGGFGLSYVLTVVLKLLPR